MARLRIGAGFDSSQFGCVRTSYTSNPRGAIRSEEADTRLSELAVAEEALGEAIGNHVASRYGSLLAEVDVVMATRVGSTSER